MPKLSFEPATLLDGDILGFKRACSQTRQVTFKMNCRGVRVSIKCKRLPEAKEVVRELYFDYSVRQKNGLPLISNCFADVAFHCTVDMQKQLDTGLGKKTTEITSWFLIVIWCHILAIGL